MNNSSQEEYNDEKFWLYDCCILLDNICSFSPFMDGSINEKLNAFTRLVIICTIVLLCINKNILSLVGGIFTIVIICIVHSSIEKDNFIETKSSLINNFNQQKLSKRKSDDVNPLKNIPISEYSKYPKYSESSKNDDNLSNFIKSKFFQTSEQYIFDKDTVQFNTTPNTSIPNKQNEFANWLYGTMDNCKSGSIHMHKTGTPEASTTCTGFDISVPTNFGKLNI